MIAWRTCYPWTQNRPLLEFWRPWHLALTALLLKRCSPRMGSPWPLGFRPRLSLSSGGESFLLYNLEGRYINNMLYEFYILYHRKFIEYYTVNHDIKGKPPQFLDKNIAHQLN